jgi:hypothetical protein
MITILEFVIYYKNDREGRVGQEECKAHKGHNGAT